MSTYTTSNSTEQSVKAPLERYAPYSRFLDQVHSSSCLNLCVFRRVLAPVDHTAAAMCCAYGDPVSVGFVLRMILSCPILAPFQVRVVEHKKTKKLYALKYISKQQCVKQKAVANVIQERQLLEEVTLPYHHFADEYSIISPLSFPLSSCQQVDHPFVVNLRYAFQDDQNCFFTLDLMLGGDLRCT